MKKLFAILAIVALFGCAQIPVKQEPVIVKLKIEGVETVKVEQEKNPIRRSMEIRNDKGELSTNAFLSGDTCYYSISGGINAYFLSWFLNDIVILRSKNIMKLVIRLNSGGGSAMDGFAYADAIMGIQSEFDVTIKATGLVASAAVPIFAVGERRIATKSTLFMLHQAVMFKLFAMEGLKDLTAQKFMMELLEKKYTDMLVAATNLSYEKLVKMQEAETWFTAEEAKSWGFVDEIQ